MGDPAFYNLYESLKAAYLYLHATGSPISSTLLNIMDQVDRLAVSNTCLLMDQLKHQFTPFLSKPTPLPDSISSVAPSVASTIISDATPVSTCCAVDDIHITSLLAQVEKIATFQELHLSSVEQQCRATLAVCENHNLQLDIQLQQSQLALQLLERANSALTAEISSLCAENNKLQSAPRLLPSQHPVVKTSDTTATICSSATSKPLSAYQSLLQAEEEEENRRFNKCFHALPPRCDASNGYHAPPWCSKLAF